MSSNKISGSPHPSISLSGLGRERKVAAFLFFTTVSLSDAVDDGDIEDLLGGTLLLLVCVFRIGELGEEDASQGKSSRVEDAVDVDEKAYDIGTSCSRPNNDSDVIDASVELMFVGALVGEESFERRFTSVLGVRGVKEGVGIGVW